MTDFLKSSARVNKAVIDATSGPNAGFETMRAALRSALQADGVIVHDPVEELGATLAPGQRVVRAPREVALPANPASQACWRAVYPHGNDRYEIYGASEAELDEKERQIRTMFGQ